MYQTQHKSNENITVTVSKTAEKYRKQQKVLKKLQ